VFIEKLEGIRSDIDIVVESLGIETADTILDALSQYIPFVEGVGRGIVEIVIGYLVLQYLTGVEDWKHSLRLFVGNGMVKRGLGAVVGAYVKPILQNVIGQIGALVGGISLIKQIT